MQHNTFWVQREIASFLLEGSAQHSTRTCSSRISCGCVTECITMWSHSTIRCGCITMRSTLMMIYMNWPDIEPVDEVKDLILEFVTVWKNFKKRVPSRGSQGPVRPASEATTRRGMFTLNSRDLKTGFQWFQQADTRKDQNERDLEALGEYKCDSGMSVEDVSAVVNIKHWRQLDTSSLLCGRWVWWEVEKKKSVADQFAVKYKSETYSWTQKLNRED